MFAGSPTFRRPLLAQDIPSTWPRRGSSTRRGRFGLVVIALLGCENSTVQVASLEPGEELPGGETTQLLYVGSNAFSLPAANILEEHESPFYSGNSFFSQPWVTAPASTTARDGLGPLYNANACAACHFKDGRGAPPASADEVPVGLLFRANMVDADGIWLGPDPRYGGQLQPFAVLGVTGEVRPSVTMTATGGSYADGSNFELLTPDVELLEFGYGPLDRRTRLSGRTAPIMIGLGLLESIPRERLEALADPDDDDGDGISGRLQILDGGLEGELLGRFGWKAEAATVRLQSAGAFAADIGITSSAKPDQPCTSTQTACAASPSGGSPEIDDETFAKVVLYSSLLAVPARRGADDEDVLRGKQLFAELACAGCHVPSHTTDASSALSELHNQLIWPYTDLLLHDMGPGLADGVPAARASGQEWRTPPLWGLGLIETVNHHDRLLHDGRARGVAEAILWHGGEAAMSAEGFRSLPEDDRTALIRFVESL